jgi:hypothetical protein
MKFAYLKNPKTPRLLTTLAVTSHLRRRASSVSVIARAKK